MSFTLLSPPGSRVMSRQDDGVDDPKARGALRASTTETLQADHQAGSPPHNQGGRLKHFFSFLINFSRCATRFQRRSACWSWSTRTRWRSRSSWSGARRRSQRYRATEPRPRTAMAPQDLHRPDTSQPGTWPLDTSQPGTKHTNKYKHWYFSSREPAPPPQFSPSQYRPPHSR